MKKFFAAIFVCCFILNPLFAQKKIVKNGKLFFSWGYNKDWYSRSSIHVSQPSLNSDYTFISTKGHDHPGWDTGILNKELTIPQYNYRIGYFFNEKQDLAIELNFDHTKYIATFGQNVHVKGVFKGSELDTNVVTDIHILRWYLNNGANFFQINVIKKINLLNAFESNLTFDGLVKAGIGPVVPHVSNNIFGNENTDHFQFGGWDADADASLRITFFKHVFLEYCNKVVYARYSHLKIAYGEAKQSFACYEMVLFLGGTFPFGKATPVVEQPK